LKGFIFSTKFFTFSDLPSLFIPYANPAPTQYDKTSYGSNFPLNPAISNPEYTVAIMNGVVELESL